jgi:hypothetical protein
LLLFGGTTSGERTLGGIRFVPESLDVRGLPKTFRASCVVPARVRGTGNNEIVVAGQWSEGGTRCAGIYLIDRGDGLHVVGVALRMNLDAMAAGIQALNVVDLDNDGRDELLAVGVPQACSRNPGTPYRNPQSRQIRNPGTPY